MRPQWFSIEGDEDTDGIPYPQMWEDDRQAISRSDVWLCSFFDTCTHRHWLPLLIADSQFVGRCDFGLSPTGLKEGGDSPMTRVWFATVERLADADHTA